MPGVYGVTGDQSAVPSGAEPSFGSPLWSARDPSVILSFINFVVEVWSRSDCTRGTRAYLKVVRMAIDFVVRL